MSQALFPDVETSRTWGGLVCDSARPPLRAALAEQATDATA
jgi:hypothetical protein